MKIRKLKGDWRNEAALMCQTIDALWNAQVASRSCSGSGDFQVRCNDAILALANKLMEEHVERFYETETKKFKVTYDVKRSGTGELVVEAKDEAEAKAKAESQLRNDPLVHETLDDLPTDFVTAGIVEAKEVRDDRA